MPPHHLSIRYYFNGAEFIGAEDGNAEVRHYLTRLARKSRCFSRCLVWLNRHPQALAQAWNQRELHNRARPFDKKQVFDFICL